MNTTEHKNIGSHYAQMFFLETEIESLQRKATQLFHGKDLQNPRKRKMGADYAQWQAIKEQIAQHEQTLERIQAETLAMVQATK